MRRSSNGLKTGTSTQKLLDVIELVGNSVPHPAVMFVIFIATVIVLSHIMYLLGASVSYQAINPDTHTIETMTTSARSLLTGDGIRHMYTRLVPNLMSFTAVGILIIAMMGVGVAEEAGLISALIRKLVTISPHWFLPYIVAFVGVLSSIAADAGYIVLIPLAAAAMATAGRHPIAGLALGFAAVGCAFNVNMLVKPLDAVLTEITNDAIHIVDPSISLHLTANLWFSMASTIVLTIVVTVVTERIIEPRLGTYRETSTDKTDFRRDTRLSADQMRGLLYAGVGVTALLVLFGFLTLPSQAPLRNPVDGALIGNSPFVNGLIGFIMMVFLIAGIGYGIGAKTIKTSSDVIAAMTKAVSGLASIILLFVVISQFVDYFTYSNIPVLLAVTMADTLRDSHIGPLWLLVAFMLVIATLNLVFTQAITKWAIFAPVFVPLFVQLSVDPAIVLAAFRAGDSPTNVITPFNVYLALVVGFAQKYDKNAGVGTIVALMLPYVFWVMITWTLLFIAWYLLGLPWGPT